MNVDGEPAAAASGSAGGGGEVERAVHAPEPEARSSEAAKKVARGKRHRLSKSARDKARQVADRSA